MQDIFQLKKKARAILQGAQILNVGLQQKQPDWNIWDDHYLDLLKQE